MTRKHYFLFLLLIASFSSVLAQDRKVVQGKIVAKFFDLEGVYVENITARKNTTTEKGGYFKIPMQPNDTLIFASVNLKGIKRIVKESDFSKKLLFIPMEVSENTLDELIIERKITAESLGLAPRKKYTRAEKNLHTATSTANSAGWVSIDAIVNAFSGRTAMLKRILELEREEMLMKKIIASFDEDFYTNELHIPKNYIEAFGFYLAQDEAILSAMKKGKKTELKFLFSQKAVEYHEIIKVLK